MHNQYTLLFESIAANQYTFIYIVLYILLEILYLTKYIFNIKIFIQNANSRTYLSVYPTGRCRRGWGKGKLVLVKVICFNVQLLELISTCNFIYTIIIPVAVFFLMGTLRFYFIDSSLYEDKRNWLFKVYHM